MNKLIQTIAELGLTGTVYDGFHVLGFIAVFIVIVWFARKLEIEAWKAVLTVLIVYPIIYGWMYVLFWIESGFRSFGGNNIVRVFIYVPLVGYPVAKIFRVEWKKICSLLSLAPTVVHAVSHLGCIFAGCCNGYPSSWGLYNVTTGDIRFPTQPIEAAIAWLIIAYLLFRAVKRNYIPDGKEYPIMLTLFGSTRFLCEFLRDNEKIFMGCSNLSFHALLMALVGIIWIAVDNHKNKIVATEATK